MQKLVFLRLFSFVLIAHFSLMACESGELSSHDSSPIEGSSEHESNPEPKVIRPWDQLDEEAAKESVKAQLLIELDRLELKEALLEEMIHEFSFASAENTLRFLNAALFGSYASIVLAVDSSSLNGLGLSSTQALQRIVARRFENRLMETINRVAKEHRMTFTYSFRHSPRFYEIADQFWIEEYTNNSVTHFTTTYEKIKEQHMTAIYRSIKVNQLTPVEVKNEIENEVKRLQAERTAAYNAKVEAEVHARQNAVAKADSYVKQISDREESLRRRELFVEQKVELKSQLKAAKWRRLTTGFVSIGLALLTLNAHQYVVMTESDAKTLISEIYRMEKEIRSQIESIRTMAQSLNIELVEITPELVEKIRASILKN